MSPKDAEGGHLLRPTSSPGCLLHYSTATGMCPLGKQGSGHRVSVLRNETAPKHRDVGANTTKL